MKLIKILLELHLRLFYTSTAYARRRGVKVGENCRIYTRNFGSEPWLIEIGDNVTITSGVKLLTHDGSTWLFRDEKGRRFLYKPIQIGNFVFIGVNSIIMPGVVIEDFVIVGAGSVVTKSVPRGSIVAGNPAVRIGNYFDFENTALNSFVSTSDLDFKLNYPDRISKVVTKVKKPFIL